MAYDNRQRQERAKQPLIPLTPLMIGASALAKLLSLSVRQVWNMHQDGTLGPLPVKLGRRTLWRYAEIVTWVAADCPRREVWADLRNNDDPE